MIFGKVFSWGGGMGEQDGDGSVCQKENDFILGWLTANIPLQPQVQA